jgi:hypothetical protein
VIRSPKPHNFLSQHKRYPAAGSTTLLTDNSVSFILMASPVMIASGCGKERVA